MLDGSRRASLGIEGGRAGGKFDHWTELRAIITSSSHHSHTHGAAGGGERGRRYDGQLGHSIGELSPATAQPSFSHTSSPPRLRQEAWKRLLRDPLSFFHPYPRRLVTVVWKPPSVFLRVALLVGVRGARAFFQGEERGRGERECGDKSQGGRGRKSCVCA